MPLVPSGTLFPAGWTVAGGAAFTSAAPDVAGERPLNDLGVYWRDQLPVVLRWSPEHLAVVHAVTREVERLEDRIEQVRRQFFPQTADLLLKVWERQLGLTAEPEGVALDVRRRRVLEKLRQMYWAPTGLEWQDALTRLLGAGWTYEEHDPDDPGSPPDYTLRITLPFAPDSSSYALAERMVRDIIPAHLDLILTFAGGFLLDSSQLDQEALQ
jgi:hypothetical protein